MGYQNNDRPNEIEFLWLDVGFDINDLREDIKNDKSIPEDTKEKLLSNLQFILKTFYQLRTKVSRKKNNA